VRVLGGAATGLALSAVLAACSGGSSAPGSVGTPPITSSAAGTAGSAASAPTSPSSTAVAPAAAWGTYHRTADRAGSVPGLPTVRALSAGWSRGLDGAVYGQPLVVGDVVVVGTENDTVYALDLTSGATRWSRHLGPPVRRKNLPCGNIDPLGITGTPAYDQASGVVFVATETAGAHHTLVGLDVRTGAVRVQAGLDLARGRDRHAEQQRGALLVANGRVYVPFGGLAGDCGNYVGYVAGLRTDGSDPRVYAVPTSREGGIWAASGVAARADGDVWAAVGNGASTGGRYDGSDSVLRLTPDLGRRVDYFAPSSWGAENAADADLGSTGPLLLDRDRVLIAGKTGDVYLLDAQRLGGIGGQVASVAGCHAYGGMAFDAQAQAAYLPCEEGLLRVGVGARELTTGWRAQPTSVQGSPVLGGGAVFALDQDHRRLYVLEAGTGRVVTERRIGEVSRFASPVLVPGHVLVGTMHGVVALRLR
jgi:outer membrane protein assembly factor BamB